jgi:hypothetical protein
LNDGELILEDNSAGGLVAKLVLPMPVNSTALRK